MRLISLELSINEPFWFLNKIHLNSENPKSNLIDIDDLTEEEVKIIESSVNNAKIRIFDSNGVRLKSVKFINYIDGELTISTEDIDLNHDPYFGNINTVTVSLDEEDEETIEEKQIEVTSQDRIDAKLLLNKNGNTIKAYLKNLEQQQNTLSFLTACLEQELSNNKRNGIIDILNNKLEDLR